MAEPTKQKDCQNWRRLVEAAQAVTTDCEDHIEYFAVPSHLMAALALALDELPNTEAKGPRSGPA